MASNRRKLEREKRRHVFLSVFKMWEEIKKYIYTGRIIMNLMLTASIGVDLHPVQPPCVVPILAYGNAATYSDIGYYVLANDVVELGGYISYLIEQARASNIEIIYVRVSIANMPYLLSNAEREIRISSLYSQRDDDI
jgi:hypothetical protein